MLKKFLIGAVAVLVLAVVVSTANTAEAFSGVTLRQGSKGADVIELQALVGAGQDGNFGPMTKASVMAWQASNGLVADGVFGPMSMAKAGGSTGTCPAGQYNPTTGLPCGTVSTLPAGCMPGYMFSSTTGASCAGTVTLPAGCSSTAGYSSTTGQLCSGGLTVSSIGEGSLTISLESSPSNATSVPYSTTTGVMAVKIKATGSDMMINRMDYNFDKRLWLYAEKAGIYDGSTLIAEKILSSSSFDVITAGSDYRLRFEGINYTIAKDATKYLTLKLTAPSIISDPNTLVTTTFGASSVRATDTAGLTSYDGVVGTRTFKVSTSVAGVLTVTADSTSPKENTLIVNTSATTADHILNVASFKATNQDVNVSTLKYTLTSTTANVDAIVSTLKLYREGTYIATASLGTCTTTCVATFSSLNEDIAKDTTVKYIVKADIFKEDTSSSYYTEGDTILATLTVSNTNVVAEDADYTTLTTGASSLVGVSTGQAQHLLVKAPILAFVSTTPSASVTTSGAGTTQTGTFTIKFTATAQGSDIYIDPTMTHAAAGSNTAMIVDGVSGAPALNLSTAATAGTNGMYRVIQGTTETFTVQGVIVAGATFDGILLIGVGYATTDAADGTTHIDWGLTDYKSSTAYLAN